MCLCSLLSTEWANTYSRKQESSHVVYTYCFELSDPVSVPPACRYLMCVNDDQVKLLLETVQMSVSSCMQHPELPTLQPQMMGRLMAAHHSSTVAV